MSVYVFVYGSVMGICSLEASKREEHGKIRDSILPSWTPLSWAIHVHFRVCLLMDPPPPSVELQGTDPGGEAVAPWPPESTQVGI